jgi:hypothetical protein
MYNINSHYENIFQYLDAIVADPRVLYLMPYGSTRPEDLETLSRDMSHWAGDRGPLFLCHDQEPISLKNNMKLFAHVCCSYAQGQQFILVTTEKNSDDVDAVQRMYKCPVVYYFHHIFAAHDWFRGVRYDSRLKRPKDRILKKKYISFNRLTSSKRAYRSLFISELIQRQILDQGYVSYNDVCPDNTKDYVYNLAEARDLGLITQEIFIEATGNIASASLPLRIDYQDHTYIPNHSFVLSAVEQTQESFVYVVTETCYWERKCHLTEKIFKPIVSQMPFILVGPAHNLKYLKEYGFKTFSCWFDESYDDIEDPIERMHAIGTLLHDLSNRSLDDLTEMLLEMVPTLEYNYNRFYSQDLLDMAWGELVTNLESAFDPKKYDSISVRE